MPAQLTHLGMTCVLLSFHVCFLSFVALKQIPFLLEEVTVYLQPMFFSKAAWFVFGLGLYLFSSPNRRA